jgi:hypothetical protein
MAQATLARPPAVPLVPSNVGGNPRNTFIRFASAINQILRGGLSATIEVTLAASATTSVFSDSRIGPYTSVLLMPMTAHAADVLPSCWVETTAGGATVHHGNSTYTDQTFTALLIG